MSLLTFTHFSKSMPGCAQVNVILPVGMEYEDLIAPGEKFQTLWLLHGHGSNYTEWARLTCIEKLAMDHKFAVVMPDAANSSYCDQPDGRKYYTYITEELPAFLRKYLPLSDKTEDNFIAGFSMGSYGAAKLGFNHPDKYSAVGILSGPNNRLTGYDELTPERKNEFKYTLGDIKDIPGSKDDIYKVFSDLKQGGRPMPFIYAACGTEDVLSYRRFTEFRNFTKSIGAENDVVFEEGPGVHSWDFWDEYIAKFVDLLPLKNRNFWRRWYDEQHRNR